MLDWPVNRHAERLPELYAPYVGHVTDNVVLLNDGSRMVIVELDGIPFELLAGTVRKNRALAFNDLLRGLPVDLIGVHLIKHETADAVELPPCHTPYGRNLMRKYHEIVVGSSARKITWLISLIVRPSRKSLLRRRIDTVDQDATERLDYAVHTLIGTLAEHAPRILGRREVPTDLGGETMTFSEVGRALYLIRTGIEQDIPETSGPLGSAIIPVSPELGGREFDLCIPGTPWFGAMVSLKDYPRKTRAGMLNELLTLNCSFSMTQTFSLENKRLDEAKLLFRETHMSHAGEHADTLSKGLKQLSDAKSSNRSTTGMSNLALAIFDAHLDSLNRHVGAAMKAIGRFGGAVAVKERNVWWHGGMEPQYWSLLPGVIWTHFRSGQISTENFAHMASLDGYSTGSLTGYWGRSSLRLRTRSGTAFNYIPGVDDVLHTAIFGKTGSGKTVVLSFLKTAMDACLGPDGLRILIDKDGSNRISIEMEGGAYATFRRGEESGVAPLRFFDDSPRNRAFFYGLYSWLIRLDERGALKPDEERRLARGIARQLKMPRHLRSMGGVREFLGYSDPVSGAGARFEKWCAGGPMGWLLDGKTHLIDLDPTKARLYGFDFTALIPKKEGETDDGSCQAAAAVISHQLHDYIDGRRIMFICDEARFYLQPLAGLLEDLALTGRKSELMLVLVAQQPEHFLDHPLGLSLMSQCPTKIFAPNKGADYNTYVNRVGLPPKAYDQLAHGMFVGEKARRFLLWRGEDESAIVEFDLSAMPDEVAIMSARSGTNRLLDQIKAETGRLPPSELRQEFLTRHARELKKKEVA